MQFLRLLVLYTLLPFSLFATELKPWYGKSLEFQGRATYLLQSYQRVNTAQGDIKRSTNDNFFTLGLELSPLGTWDVELETTCSYVRRQDFGWDDIRLTGRYLWLDDVSGAPISLTTGITVLKVFEHGLKNITTFYHGGIEGEFHLAIGKEQSCNSYWTSRWWSVFGVGIADLGSPWLRGELHWEKNCWNTQQYGVFIRSLWGLGNRKLTLQRSFHGYGPINHQSVDVGGRYCYNTECWGILSAEYAWRAYSLNCPKSVSLFMLRLHYPFGL